MLPSQAYETQAHHSAARIASASTSRVQVGCARDEARHLRDREHEHEVEEELERGDALLGRGRPLRLPAALLRSRGARAAR